MNTIKRMPVRYLVGGAVVIVVVGIIVVRVMSASSASDTTAASGTAHVTVASVASLSDQSGPLPVTGKVTSLNKADILAQNSGEIVSLSRSLGDRVAAGSVIASFENSSQRAAVLQAQGAYEGAQASLAKASGSTAQNSNTTSASAAQSAQNAAAAANAALRSAYASLDDAVHTKADALFSNPHSTSPQLNITVPDGQLATDIQNERVALDPLLKNISMLGSDPADTSVDANTTAVIADARTVEVFLDNMVAALNKAITSPNFPQATLATYQASIAGARTEVLGVISSLTAAKSAYDSAVSGATVAQNSASNGTQSDIAGAQATVKSALGALNAAQANLEKTIIRAPISGTIVSLPITRGGYVTAFSPVAQISNPGALEVVAYVTSDDAKTLVVGGKATIEGSTSGVVVFIAPALDPTIGKIQVKVGLPDTQKTLTDGNTVTVTLDRGTGSAKTAVKSVITIPIAAAKLTPGGPVVFTVASSTLEAHPIVFGPIVGSQVTVASGLTLDMDIVTDARGLAEGQTIVIDPTK